MAIAEPVTPIRTRLASPGVPAAHAGLLVREDAHPFALVGRWAGAAALAGAEPLALAPGAVAAGDPTSALGAVASGNPMAFLDAQPTVTGAIPDGFVGGGWFGALGYGLGRALEPTLGAPPPAPRGEALPAVRMAFYDHVLRCDAEGAWWFEALWTDARAAFLDARREELAARLAAAPAPRPFRSGAWRATPSAAGHARAVEACRERIAAGDLFQANLALRLRGEVEGELLDLFTTGAAALAPDRAAWLADGDDDVLASFSPELFLERRGSSVRTAPIKGTRPASGRDELAASAKDRAENIMIVDLMRNDLGRVCAPGSVQVTALAEPRAHVGVWHLVSEVVGELAPRTGDAALLAATFPPGSVTGAPKLAAMDVISALEGTARQTFCGAIGFASPTAGLELSVAIRTFESTATTTWLDAGGAITTGSDPTAEAAECLAKAMPLLAAIGATLEATDDSAGAAVPRPLRLGAHPVPRPDPARGVFETILVVDGVALAVEEHLERLGRAAREVYGFAVPEAVEALVRYTALEQGRSCRLRVVLDARGDVGVEVGELPEPGDVVLEPVVLAGGLGDRKWRDRRWVDAAERATAPAIPLLVDADGQVLETTRANVFAVLADDTIVTPPLDGRILPGVTRAAVGEALDARERPLTLADLHAAEAVLVCNALRGLETVTRIGNRALSAPSDRVRTSLSRFPPLR
ncbi:chorismate-binding protein [Conexibacter woesei]|uniref:chorismate-binding protein n=1 Tax=Conexibacter woesei TaxID=191495 RepID=UPI0003F90610|nr:chorismate-binding protein [Conexibacter woesei]